MREATSYDVRVDGQTIFTRDTLYLANLAAITLYDQGHKQVEVVGRWSDPREPREGEFLAVIIHTCPNCAGRGETRRWGATDACGFCSGRGWVRFYGKDA